jgi:hypothetical protein
MKITRIRAGEYMIAICGDKWSLSYIPELGEWVAAKEDDRYSVLDPLPTKRRAIAAISACYKC